jgi:ATP-binding cassette subfamily C (CFTR/MRP) protein 1
MWTGQRVKTRQRRAKDSYTFRYSLSSVSSLLSLSHFINPPGFINTISFNYFFHSGQTTGLKAQNALNFMIYKKSLTLSPMSRKSFDSGFISNLLSTDGNKILLYFQFVGILIAAPIQIMLIIGLMVWQIGPAALAGVGLLVVFAPLQGILFKHLSLVRREIAPITDQRIKLTNEILAGIRVIKYFAWGIF